MLEHQTVEGSFWEVTWLPDRKANASLQWPGNDPITQRNISLTAHVLIMLDAVTDLPGVSSFILYVVFGITIFKRFSVIRNFAINFPENNFVFH